MGREKSHCSWSVMVGLAIVVVACSPGSAVPSAAPSATQAATSPTPTVLPTPSAAPVARSDEPWIAFQQFPGTSTVVLARPDGSDLRSPTSDVPGGDQTNPDWSPDGSQVVFAVTIDGRDDLWVVNADGTGARLLADCIADCMNLDDPAWSPDGRTVLYSRMRNVEGVAVSTLEHVDVASGAVEVIVTAAPAHFYAGQRWSPDGKSVVLEVVELTGASVDSGVEDVSLAIIDVAAPTAAGRELIGAGRFPETAAWAPDGSVIVFAALEASGASGDDLYVIGADGQGLRRITTIADEGGNATHPDVSPDGSSVVFAARLPGESRTVLGLVDLDGGGDIVPAMGATFIEGVHPRLRPVP